METPQIYKYIYYIIHFFVIVNKVKKREKEKKVCFCNLTSFTVYIYMFKINKIFIIES